MLIKAGLLRMNTVGIVMYASGRNTTKNAAMQMILAVLFLRNIPPSCFPRISCMMTSTAVKRIKSMAIHCLKANTLAICDNDNNENGNTASSGIGIVAFCGIIRYKIAAANRKIVLLLHDLFVAMAPPPFLLYFARPCVNTQLTVPSL